VDYDRVNIMPPNKELSITLWIDTEAQKVCFAEASKDVVDFLSCLLCLTMNTIISLLSKERMVGSIGNVYGSVQRMGTKYLSSDVTWEPYLKPTILDITALSPLQQLLDKPLPVNTYNFFTCEGKRDGYHNINPLPYPTCCGYFTGVQGYICPHCCKPMDQTIKHVKSSGLVIEKVATYTIKDDLSVAPASSMSSSVTLLVQCGVKDLSMLQQKTVKIRNEEVITSFCFILLFP
jgi:hypothetical protein